MLSVPGVIPDWATFLFAAGLVVGPLYAWLVGLPAAVRDREGRVHAARYGHKLMLTLVALLLTAGAAHAQGRGYDHSPQLVYAPDPKYSEEAVRAKISGMCLVSLTVDEQGNPQRVQVVRPLGHGLDEKAVEAVKQYRFKPATLQGKPVPVEVNIEVNFRINGIPTGQQSPALTAGAQQLGESDAAYIQRTAQVAAASRAASEAADCGQAANPVACAGRAGRARAQADTDAVIAQQAVESAKAHAEAAAKVKAAAEAKAAQDAQAAYDASPKGQAAAKAVRDAQDAAFAQAQQDSKARWPHDTLTTRSDPRGQLPGTWLIAHDYPGTRVQIGPHNFQKTTGEFRTNVITELLSGDIVQSPQAAEITIDADCQSRTYQIWGTGITDPNGFFQVASGPENVAHRVIQGTPMDWVFGVFCR